MNASTPAGVTAFVGLGSNLGDPIAAVRRAMQALARLPGTRLETCSSLYRTAPIGVRAQPDFINAVCRLTTTLDPAALMRALLDIERAHGRVRGDASGEPRVLDLDLLLYADRTMRTPELTVPHPRLHERAFVLYPLREIAPDLAIPGRGTVRALAAGCADQRVERLTSDG